MRGHELLMIRTWIEHHQRRPFRTYYCPTGCFVSKASFSSLKGSVGGHWMLVGGPPLLDISLKAGNDTVILTRATVALSPGYETGHERRP